MGQNTYSDFDSLIITISQWMQDLLSDWGIPGNWIVYVKLIVMLIIVSTVAYFFQFIVRRVLIFVFQRITKVSSINFFEYAIKNRLPHYLALVIPYSLVRGTIPLILVDFKHFIKPCVKFAEIYLIFMIIWTIVAVFKSFADLLQEKPAFHNKPMKSYIQVIQIILFIFGAVGIFCILTGKSPAAFFAAMGAASAVLMLMFKDSIMGFVGSIQISTNNMVQIGDWITMNKYGADGTVEEINLTTVKVRNFDKTITTIPTYALISDSFQNWRGMQESGGRRCKKAIYIKQSDIRFVTDEELDKYKKIAGLEDFIKNKLNEYNSLNSKSDNSLAIGKHSLTNNDLFMQYAVSYLRNHPRVNKEMTLMVRQLAPTSEGLPVEIYIFTDTTVWVQFESITAELINHLISSVSFFDLHIFESSSGSDDYNVHMKDKDKN